MWSWDGSKFDQLSFSKISARNIDHVSKSRVGSLFLARKSRDAQNLKRNRIRCKNESNFEPSQDHMHVLTRVKSPSMTLWATLYLRVRLLSITQTKNQRIATANFYFLSNLGKFKFSLFQEPVEMRCKCEDDLCQNIGWKMFNPAKQKSQNGVFMGRHEPIINQKDLVCLPNSRGRNRGQVGVIDQKWNGHWWPMGFTSETIGKKSYE